MDIKPSNLCLSGAGDAILVDLGSVVKRSSPSQPSSSESTMVYVPRDFQPRRRYQKDNKYTAEDLCDWWMLAMTVAEKVYGVSIGGAAPPLLRQELIDLLNDDFPELVARLTIV
mmetsp:Transcript_4248/g.5965  ORF Transcript_4248/g.5965 Transcript_4248/m.5965 type:complete len:114 (-) Transcript_4248:487-828(-)